MPNKRRFLYFLAIALSVISISNLFNLENILYHTLAFKYLHSDFCIITCYQ